MNQTNILKEGYWELYWSNGNLHSKEGFWKFYSEKGELERQEMFI